MESKNCEKPAATGTLRLTYDGIIRFHGKTPEGELCGYTGTYVPELKDTLEINQAELRTTDIKKLPGPHSFKGRVGMKDVEIEFADVSITFYAAPDPEIASHTRIEGSGRGNIGLGQPLAETSGGEKVDAESV